MPFRLPKWFGSKEKPPTEEKGARPKEIQLIPLTKKMGETAEQKNTRNTFLTMPSPLPDTKTLTSSAPKKQLIQDRLIYYIEQSCHFNILPFMVLNIFEFVFYNNNKHHLPDDISDRPKLLKAIQSPKVFHIILRLHQRYQKEKNLSPTIKHGMGILFRTLSFGLLVLSQQTPQSKQTTDKIKEAISITNELKKASLFSGDGRLYPNSDFSLELVDQLNENIKVCGSYYLEIGMFHYQDWGCMEKLTSLILPSSYTFIREPQSQIHNCIKRKMTFSIIPAIREFGFFGLLLQSYFFTYTACCISEKNDPESNAKYYSDKAIYTALLASYLMHEHPRFYHQKIISPRSVIFPLGVFKNEQGIDIHILDATIAHHINWYHEKMQRLGVQNISSRFFTLNHNAMNMAEHLITNMKTGSSTDQSTKMNF